MCVVFDVNLGADSFRIVYLSFRAVLLRFAARRFVSFRIVFHVVSRLDGMQWWRRSDNRTTPRVGGKRRTNHTESI